MSQDPCLSMQTVFLREISVPSMNFIEPLFIRFCFNRCIQTISLISTVVIEIIISLVDHPLIYQWNKYWFWLSLSSSTSDCFILFLLSYGMTLFS